jgi:hypothetical protein
MARASTLTLIPLDRVAQVLNIEPLHFNTVVSSYGIENRNACDDVWYQYDWQMAGRFSREELARVIREAETVTAKHLGYYPVPTWIEQEEHDIISAYRQERYNYRNAVGGRRSFFANYGHVIAGGIRLKSEIDTRAAVVYSDEDLDLYEETATVTVATTVTDIEEIHVYFPGYSGDDAWEIRPVDVEISGGIATIVFPKAYGVLPNLQNKVPSPDDPTLEVDGDVNANFVSTVEVYRVYHSDSQRVYLFSDPSCGSSVPVSVTGDFYIRDAKRGICAYTQATYDAVTNTWTPSASCYYMPYRLEAWYRAGLRNLKSSYPHLRMEETLERLIIYYALTLADKNICGCSNFQDHVEYLNEDLSRVGDRISYQVTPRILNNPLGTKRAAINLWQYITQIQLGSSVRR